MKYRLTWIDENGEKQLKIFEAKTERTAINKTRKLLDGTKITDPFLCPDAEYESEENK